MDNDIIEQMPKRASVFAVFLTTPDGFEKLISIVGSEVIADSYIAVQPKHRDVNYYYLRYALIGTMEER